MTVNSDVSRNSFPTCKGIKPYPEQIDSDISWLGSIPAHWLVLPGRACFREKKIPNKGMRETTVLSLSYGLIVVKPEDKLHGLVPESFETYQIVDPGDIIFRPTDLQNDTVSLRFGISRNRGIITSAYLCLKTSDLLSEEYGYRLLHTYDLKKIFYGLGSGLRQNIDWRDFKYLPCLVPPPDEQKAIVRFLDHVDRRIKRYIRAKQRLIKLLNEQKQAIIHQAVTRGLDPNVRLKPSGVDWLGDIPEHWDIRKLKYLGRSIIGLTYNPSEVVDEGQGILVLRASNVVQGRTAFEDNVYVNRRIPDSLLTKENDILICARSGSRALIGKNVKIGRELAGVSFGAFMLIFRSELNNYLQYVFNSKLFEYQSGLFLTSTINQLTKSDLNNFKIPIPPLNEQAAIIEYLSEAICDLEKTVDNTIKELNLIKDFHAKLMADVVTGKLNVLATSARFPEGFQELEVIEEDSLEGEEEQSDQQFTIEEG